jgi:hypothetical protein
MSVSTSGTICLRTDAATSEKDSYSVFVGTVSDHSQGGAAMMFDLFITLLGHGAEM